MDDAQIELIENAGRTATVWVPDTCKSPQARPLLPGVFSAIGLIAAVGVLIAYVI